jgi:hypothetical protein
VVSSTSGLLSVLQRGSRLLTAPVTHFASLCWTMSTSPSTPTPIGKATQGQHDNSTCYTRDGIFTASTSRDHRDIPVPSAFIKEVLDGQRGGARNCAADRATTHAQRGGWDERGLPVTVEDITDVCQPVADLQKDMLVGATHVPGRTGSAWVDMHVPGKQGNVLHVAEGGADDEGPHLAPSDARFF